MSGHTPGPWIQYNHLAHSYECKDEAHVPAELAENVYCFADAFLISEIRVRQRAAIAKATNQQGNNHD